MRDKQIMQISNKLCEILDNDTDEKIMIFTDNAAANELCGQINRLLDDRQKNKVENKRQQNAMKKMLSNISHDIKTPLTVILGYLDILRMKDPSDETITKVENKAKEVVELINEFFTLAKVEAGDNKLKIARINISEEIKKNMLGFYDVLAKEFEVDINISDKDIYVKGDASAIHRILSNLVSNVIRYGKDGRYIGVFLRETEEDVFVDVVDHGQGIDKEFEDIIFDRLYTMEDSRNRRIQGNGLGLTIAKSLANQMGGDLFVQSTPGIKTTFTVKLKKMKY